MRGQSSSSSGGNGRGGVVEEIGMKMRVMKETGRVSDLINASTNDGGESSSDEFQHLIIVPKPFRNKCSRFLRLFFLCLVVSVSLFVIYLLLLGHVKDEDYNTDKYNLSAQRANGPFDICHIKNDWKIDCFPQSNADQNSCLRRGCCWADVGQNGVPFCYYSVGFSYYSFGNLTDTPSGKKGGAKLIRKSTWPNDLKELSIEIIHESVDSVRIRITDPKKKRFEVPLPYNYNYVKPPTTNYTVNISTNGFRVYRLGEQFPLFDSTIAPIIFADQLIQISTRLPSTFLYGIGDSVDSFKRDMNWTKSILWNHDNVPKKNSNLYASHPFFMVMDKSGTSYGVFLANSNAMEVLFQPGPAVTFRTIGGMIDLHIFTGPSPALVMDQYTRIIGRPQLPAYWGLGFHLCRFGYGNLSETKRILSENQKAGIPIDVQWNDLDYMDNQNDFTYDPVKFNGLKTFVDQLHTNGMHYVPLIDCGIGGESTANKKYAPYDDGIDMDIFIKNSIDNKPFRGKVWNPNSTVWPDFSHANVSSYWLKQFQNFHNVVEFDGAWLDMNEPANFLDGSTTYGCLINSSFDYPPYTPAVQDGKLYYKTICPSAKHYNEGLHYNLHNLYSTMEAITTNQVLGDIRSERPFIISRSSFPGLGAYAGIWTGDVKSTYEDMKQSIPQILNAGLYGIPLVGADICGFNGNSSVDLCRKWSMLGAFYPFSRNHNTRKAIPQDPWSMGPDVVNSAKEALNLRYSLLPYIYTLFFRAHLTGVPVARPLFFEFPNDVYTFDIDTQFMIGESIMVIPLLTEETPKTIEAYLPVGWWYQHYFPEIIDSLGDLSRSIEVPTNSIPILYRGGSIIVKQIPGKTTTESRKNKFVIEVYLANDGKACGDFYWDDGVGNSPEVLVQYNKFVLLSERDYVNMKVEKSGYKTKMLLGELVVKGLRQVSIHNVIMNNVNFNYTYVEKTLKVDMSTFDFDLTEGFNLVWK